MMYISVVIKGKIDSRELWLDIKSYKVNVTDMVVWTLVYGEVSMYDATVIISICQKYGDINVELNSI